MIDHQDDYKIVINWDTAGMWLPIVKHAEIPTDDTSGFVQQIEQIIDEHAAAAPLAARREAKPDLHAPRLSNRR